MRVRPLILSAYVTLFSRRDISALCCNPSYTKADPALALCASFGPEEFYSSIYRKPNAHAVDYREYMAKSSRPKASAGLTQRLLWVTYGVASDRPRGRRQSCAAWREAAVVGEQLRGEEARQGNRTECWGQRALATQQSTYLRLAPKWAWADGLQGEGSEEQGNKTALFYKLIA